LKVRTFNGLGPDEILRQENIDTNIARVQGWGVEFNDTIGREGSTCLRPKFHGDKSEWTLFEYRVLCECFSEATETDMVWSNQRMWREMLSPFQEWVIDSRHRFKTEANIKFATDFVDDMYFPRSNNVHSQKNISKTNFH